MSKPRVAIVSPFIDKRHGTERSVAECIERLSNDYEIHLYSNRVEDVDLGRITWHRVPKLPGPHLLAYSWWFLANHLWRWRDRQFRGLAPDIVFSPGINCLDADAIQVHVVFAQLREHLGDQLNFRRSPWHTWHEIAHRRIYYRLIASLERGIYPRPQIPLIAVSHKTAGDLARFYGRTSNVDIAYHGLDLDRFQPARRESLRAGARQSLTLARDDFAVLLIGNDWKSKGLPCLLNAAGSLGDSRLTVLIVGRDNPAPFQEAIGRHGLAARIRFLPPRPDVEFYYAAADAYASPTLEDSFGLPVVEAMACGLPVITSRAAGASEIIHSGQDGFVLEQPGDFAGLAEILQRLLADPESRARIAENAASTARKLTWDDSAGHIRAAWEQARRSRLASGKTIVCLFTEMLSPGGVQRAGRHVAAAVSEFASQRGIPCRFLSLNDPHGLHSVRVGSAEFSVSGYARNRLPFIRAAWRAAGRKPSLVLALHPHLAPVVWLMKLRARHARSIVFAHGVEVWRPLAWPRGAALRGMDLLIAPSEDTARHLASDQGIPAAKIRKLPWGLDPEFASQVAGRIGVPRIDAAFPAPLPANARVILAVGRWDSSERYKGADTLIAALPRVQQKFPDAVLVLVGDGDDRPRLEQLARDAGVSERTRFLCGLTQEQLFACYAACEIFALPSAGEGFGLVFLEAMAHGKPVIAGGHGGALDVVEDGVTGYLVPHGDAVRLAGALVSLLADPRRAEEMGARGRERVQRLFSFERFQSQFTGVLNDVVVNTSPERAEP